MNDEYDFSIAQRGKFFRNATRLVPPLYLEPDVLDYLSKLAVMQGTSLSDIVNKLLKEDIERIAATE